ncbi:hypothetical protein ACFO9Q_09325 [Paenibacillus sp. GCM10023252]|uniref:hypothetical protein n=1 Tax=Paenibacillus sp. GCM10023252 TaxID=3252649 RepID=UPI003620A273
MTTDNESYTIAQLNGREEALGAISRLEQELSEQIGTPITLIAYAHDSAKDDKFSH